MPDPQEPQEKTRILYDAVSKDYSLGTYDEFKTKLQDPSKRKAFYEGVGKEYQLGTYDEFESKVGASKKKAVSEPLSTTAKPLSNGAATQPPTSIDAQSPSVEKPIDIEAMAVENGNPIDLSLTIHDNAASASGTDDSGIESSKKLREATKKKFGVTDNDIDEIANDFKDFPKEAHERVRDNGEMPFSKENLLKLRNENKPQYQRLISQVKNQYTIKDAVAKNAMQSIDDADPDKDYKANQIGIRAANNYNRLNDVNPLDLNQVEQNTKQQLDIVNANMDGSQREKIIDNLKRERAVTYTPNNPEIQQRYAASPLKDKMNAVQFAALEQMRLFDPVKADEYEKVVGLNIQPEYETQASNQKYGTAAGNSKSKKENAATVQQRLGQETFAQRLNQAGRENQMAYLHEQYYNARQHGDTDAMNRVASQINSTIGDIANDKGLFPLSNQLETDKKVIELTQSPTHGIVGNMVYHAGKTIGETLGGVVDVVKGISGSDSPESKAETIGESEQAKAIEYVPSTYSMVQNGLILAPDAATKRKVKEIEENESYTPQQRADALKDVASQINWVTNPELMGGNKSNVTAKSLLYAGAGMLGDVAGYAAMSAGLGGLGVGKMIASSAPLFTSTYAQKYDEAVSEGMGNPNEYATIHAAIPALIAIAAGSPLDRIKAALGTESKLGQTVAGFTESEWGALASKESKTIQKFKDILGNTVKEGANITGTWGALPSVAGNLADNAFFNKNKSAEEIIMEAADASKHAFLSSLGLLGAGAVSRVLKSNTTESPYNKSMLWEIGDTPDVAIQKVDDALMQGKIDATQSNTYKDTIKEVSSLIDKIPKLNADDKFYTDTQRADLLYNLYMKNKAKESKGISPSGNEKADMAIAKLDMANDLILEPKTYKQLQSAKEKLEKQLEEKGDDGKLVLKDVQRVEVQGQLEAVNEQIEKNEKQGVSAINVKEKPTQNAETNTPTDTENKQLPTNTEGLEGTGKVNNTYTRGQTENTGENDKGGEGQMTGVTHHETDAVAKELGLPTYEESPETIAKWDAEADKRLIDDHKTIGKLLKKLDDGIQPDKVDQRVMLKYLASLKSKIDATPTNELISEYKRAKDLSDVMGGREVAKSLVARKGLVPVEDNLADYMVREMETSGVGELTKEQRENVQKEYEDIKAANDALKLRVEELESAKSKTAADKAVKGTKPTSTNQKKSHDEYVKEREEVVAKIREKLNKPNDLLYALPIPLADKIAKLTSISPEVAKLVKSYVEEGINKLEDIVENLRPLIKELIPGSTDKDIHDLIAGEHNEKKKPRNEIAKRLFELRTESKLVNKLDALLNGVEPISAKKKIKRNQEIEKLSKQIKEHDLTKLAETKTRIKGEVTKVENDLKTGNFFQEPIKKEILKPDKEAVALRDLLLKLKEDREIRLMKEEFSKQSKLSKAGRYLGEVSNIGRVAKSSFDVSMPFRQGLWGLARQLLTLPIGDNISFKTQRELVSQFKKMYTALGSEKVSRRIMADIHESPRYDLAQKSGLHIAEPLSRFAEAREEVYGPSLLERIPLIGKSISLGSKIPIIGKEGRRIGGFVKASERAATTFVNSMKWDIFNNFVDSFENNGKTFENSKDLYEAAAAYANQAVGRGKLTESVERANAVTSKLFFSLRLQASRLQLLTYLVNPKFYTKIPKEIRIEYLKDMARFVSLGMTTLAIANQLGLKVGINPFASNFGKVQVGDTEYDIWGGFSQWAVFLMRMIEGKKVNSHGETVDANRLDIAGRFARSKASPEMSFLMNVTSGKDYLGRETSIGKESLEFINPLIISDTKQAAEDGGVMQGLITFLLASHGIGTQTYEHSPSSNSKQSSKHRQPPHGKSTKHEYRK